MCPRDNYTQILEQYPPVISKEQFYRICHISKKTAQYFLESGLIPCRCSGKKTRKYKINTADVVHFLIERNSKPGQLRATKGWYASNKHSRGLSPAQFEALRNALEQILPHYPDTLSCVEIAAIVGCRKETVAAWCREDKMKHFLIRQKYWIPQSYFLDYLSAGEYRSVSLRSFRHIVRLAETTDTIE